MHNLSTFFQFLRHLTTDTIQFIKICQNCDQHTQHDRDPDKADFNMRQCTRDLYRISYIAAFFQEDSDNETCQSHSAFYEKSLECSNQSHSCVSQCIDKFCYQLPFETNFICIASIRLAPSVVPAISPFFAQSSQPYVCVCTR